MAASRELPFVARSLAAMLGIGCAAGVAAGEDTIFVPVRWVAMEGSQAADDPGSNGYDDTDDALLTRLAAASECIWFPQTRICFISALTTGTDLTSFPLIDDPCPPLPDGCASCDDCPELYENCPEGPCPGPGDLGDIFYAEGDDREIKAALQLAAHAWGQDDNSARGPLAINIRRFVDSNGNSIDLDGKGYWIATGGEPVVCEGVLYGLSANTSFCIVEDETYVTHLGRLLAHELGHVLTLGHGNGCDDDAGEDGCNEAGATGWDDCDADEDHETERDSLMASYGLDSETITNLQSARARLAAEVMPGREIEGGAALSSVDVYSGSVVDSIVEVTEPSIDVRVLGLVENTPLSRATIGHELYDHIPDRAESQYVTFLDTDNDPATGGCPADLGFVTEFEGAELVTLADVQPGLSVSPTVWRYEGGTFVEVQDPFISAQIVNAVGNDSTRGARSGQEPPPFVNVEVTVSTMTIQFLVAAVRVQAIAVDVGTGEQDQVPDGDPGAAAVVTVAHPVTPTCDVSPSPVAPGEVVTVGASGLLSNQEAEIFLGIELVATATTDGEGMLSAEIVVPLDAVDGPHLVMVQIDGTAVSAGCTLIVSDPCPWDLDDDGTVATRDLLALLAAWTSDPSGPGDFDGDGAVDPDDVQALLANWGPCP